MIMIIITIFTALGIAKHTHTHTKTKDCTVLYGIKGYTKTEKLQQIGQKNN
jgi:hypothetical protein